jgi:DNA (cytosine-5)-methyltransferase 1
MKLRVFTAFSGYDSQCMALDRLKEVHPEFDYELIGWSEIDKYAIDAHNAVYPQWSDRNFGDISKIDWSQVGDFELFTYSFPCQSISSAGKQAGFEEGSGTRSSLLWECKKAIVTKHPKYLLMENVKAITQKKFMPFFVAWRTWLEEQGYKNFWQILNAKNYGVPQNRERCFMVSILDKNAHYEFPKPFELEKRLKDVLEEEVDEGYYLKPQQVERIVAHCDRKVAEGCGFKTNFTPPPPRH